jgi:hypothetical protein
MPVRFFLASLFIFLGAVLSVPAAIAVWQEREIQDEDAFVSNVQDITQNENVQEILATRLTARIMTRTDIRARITEGLDNLEERAGENAPPGIPLLAAPLTRLANDTIFRICLTFLQSDEFQQVLETATRVTHRAVMAVVKNDSPLLNEVGGQVTLNLRPVIMRVVEELAGERGEQALERIDIPEDAGIIVISEESEHPWLWDLVRWIDDFNPVIPIVSAVLLILGILVANNRRRAVMAAGAALVLVAGLILLALAAPVKELATSWPATDQGQMAAKEIYDDLLDGFRRQELFVVFIGVAMIVIAAALGDRRLVEAMRKATRGQETDGNGVVRERTGALRLAGLAIAGVILIFWPDPDLRTVLTVGFLLVLYLSVIWLIASDSELADRMRTRFSDALVGSSDLPVQRAGFVGWVATHAGLLRLFGVIVAACLVLFVWDLSLGGFVLIAAAALLYFAAIEWAYSAARQPPVTGEPLG